MLSKLENLTPDMKDISTKVCEKIADAIISDSNRLKNTMKICKKGRFPEFVPHSQNINKWECTHSPRVLYRMVRVQG